MALPFPQLTEVESNRQEIRAVSRKMWSSGGFRFPNKQSHQGDSKVTSTPVLTSTASKQLSGP